jgi:hypothetical protein
MKENPTPTNKPINKPAMVSKVRSNKKRGKTVLSPNMKDSGFVAEIPSQFCSHECIAHDDKYKANDENIMVVFHHAIERGQDAHNKDDYDQSFPLHCISL